MRNQVLGSGLLAGTQTALAPFELYRPRSAEEAVQAYHEAPDATLLAGSTDLVARFREGLSPRAVIALSGVTAWRDVIDDGDLLRLGALATHHSGPRDLVLRERLPSLADAWARIATVRIRARATLGGNLMARQSRYETPVMLAALDAELELSALDGERRVTLAQLWRGDSAPAGVLHHVRVPLANLVLFDYERSMRPLLTVALAVRTRGSALRVTATVGSEYRRPVTVWEDVDAPALSGVDPEAVGRALAAQLPDEIGDYVGSAAYRRRVVAVLIRRRLNALARPAAA
ncbi:FAD binding domain-containing protein [Amycolatopsis sp. NPDC005232]|uniref:FAD binding domain-containing protein n=1 Tax=Amycolatopsis sp. NPDC005232 TaxID=3157027 RepID=UPI0033BB786A